ncbi:hypothetical protein [Gloeobacter violaceus]|uniref:Gsr4085 protein n=1 Tax=Gloeobacter violaceus (strain ATCC 29082 / PCC 7421) TaxID=251221 RepID=Q7NDZ7_GLOVI|nr:hypothetical protein [Gloeobacter violaceus]BAC92026.1 gsr4085 [Gloeobacter violaceus PCC 7421]
MNDKPMPPIPDAETRRQAREKMLAAAAELRKSAEEIQILQEMFDRDYEESPIGQFHARRQAQLQAEQKRSDAASEEGK